MFVAQRVRLVRALLPVFAALFALFAIGCGGGLQVTKLSSVRGTPSNVALFMSIERDGKPVTGLTPNDFAVYEDGLLLSKSDAQVSLQPVAVGAVTHTLILVDRSNAGAKAIGAEELAAIEPLTQRAAKLGKVAVYAFDGDDEIHPILPFSDEVENAPFGAIAAYTPKDASSNLYGAALRAVDELESSLSSEPEPLRFGALVIIAGGPDRAARKTLSDVTSALDNDKHPSIDIFTIAAGPGAADAKLEKIGRTASYRTGPLLTVAAASTQAADAIEAHWKRYYLLSYCTPARKGEHKVRVEVKTSDPPASGAIGYSFVADGMGPGCNPDRPPKFAGLDTSSDGPIRKEEEAGTAAPRGGSGATAEHAVVAARGQTLGMIAAPAKLAATASTTNDAQNADDDASDDDAADDDKSDDKNRGSKKPAKKSDKDKHEKNEAKKGEKKAEKAEAKKPEPKKAEPKKAEPKKPAAAPKKK